MNYMVGVAWQQKNDYKKHKLFKKRYRVLETQDKDLFHKVIRPWAIATILWRYQKF
jgi:hypothetical protein